ncbi:MAG: response regulator transcription factor [Sandaracinus sp.]
MADNGSTRLLVVDDEEHLAMGLKLNLELEGYEVQVARDGHEAEKLIAEGPGFGAIVLDVMLPDFDGFELCARLREAGDYTPVVMLTARSAAEDRVRGLEVGADDYLVKPFELDELLARVRSMLRRQQWDRRGGGAPPKADATAHKVVRIGESTVDFDSHEVVVRGKPVKLTRLELDLLHYFIEHPGVVISRNTLLEDVWKLRNYSTARTVDNFVSRLRRHFEDDVQNPRHFVSVRGAGYKYVA